MSTARSYVSPLREEKARETADAILAALFGLMEESGGAPEAIAMEAIAERAGVTRRTVFRHFPTKAALLEAFWSWLNARIGVSPTPQALADIVEGPVRTFPRFDAHEAAIRASLHSPAGREMRMGALPGRRASFAQALSPALADAAPADAARILALAHLLYSASAWEVLKDYGGLTGAQAGEAATWALEVILSAITPGKTAADSASQIKETGDGT